MCRLVGLEQTMESIPLPGFSFMEKTILVLGRESSGIPAQILQVLSHRVELKSLCGSASLTDEGVQHFLAAC